MPSPYVAQSETIEQLVVGAPGKLRADLRVPGLSAYVYSSTGTVPPGIWMPRNGYATVVGTVTPPNLTYAAVTWGSAIDPDGILGGTSTTYGTSIPVAAPGATHIVMLAGSWAANTTRYAVQLAGGSDVVDTAGTGQRFDTLTALFVGSSFQVEAGNSAGGVLFTATVRVWRL